MGLIELAFVALSGVGAAVAVWVALRTAPPAPARPPLPVGPAVGAAVLAIAGLSLGAALSGWVFEPLVHRVTGPGERILMTIDDAGLAQLTLALLTAWWGALPGVAGLGWLLASRRRSPGAAAVFAGVVWLGATAGLAFGWALLAPISGTGFVLVAVVDSIVRFLLGTAVAGAVLAGAWGVAAASAEGLRAAAIATLAMPFVALTTAAALTPPDVVSQVLLAVVIGTSWLLGLGAGAFTRATLARRSVQVGGSG